MTLYAILGTIVLAILGAFGLVRVHNADRSMDRQHRRRQRRTRRATVRP